MAAQGKLLTSSSDQCAHDTVVQLLGELMNVQRQLLVVCFAFFGLDCVTYLEDVGVHIAQLALHLFQGTLQMQQCVTVCHIRIEIR